jgi:hypothetical protein
MSVLISDCIKIGFSSFNIELYYSMTFGYVVLTRGGWWGTDTVKVKR